MSCHRLTKLFSVSPLDRSRGHRPPTASRSSALRTRNVWLNSGSEHQRARAPCRRPVDRIRSSCPPAAQATGGLDRLAQGAGPSSGRGTPVGRPKRSRPLASEGHVPDHSCVAETKWHQRVTGRSSGFGGHPHQKCACSLATPTSSARDRQRPRHRKRFAGTACGPLGTQSPSRCPLTSLGGP